MDPTITKGKWEVEEDERLLKAVLTSDPRKWRQIANKMPGRRDIQVRYRIVKLKQWMLERGVAEEYLPD